MEHSVCMHLSEVTEHSVCMHLSPHTAGASDGSCAAKDGFCYILQLFVKLRVRLLEHVG